MLTKIVAFAVVTIILVSTLALGFSLRPADIADLYAKQQGNVNAPDTVIFEDSFKNSPVGSFPSSTG
jgi:hypothetical protein